VDKMMTIMAKIYQIFNRIVFPILVLMMHCDHAKVFYLA